MSTARFDAVSAGTSPSRDLASVELWERSLARSRQRRRLTELGRRARRRRKGASLAVSAAIAAGPVLPQGIATAAQGSGTAVAGSTDGSAEALLHASGGRVVLHFGNEGALVAAAQRRLNEILPVTHLAVDGIFGPLTRGAVREFQRHHGLAATGAIDVGTWASMFRAPVLLMGAATGTTSALGGGSASAGSAVPAASGREFVSTSTAAGHTGAVGALIGGAHGNRAGAPSGPSGAGTQRAAGSGAATGSGGSAGGSSGSSGTPPVTVVSPSNPTTQPSTYVLTNGVALPLPRGYIVNPYVDQGVDYSAPGGTPLYAMGDGVIIGEGIGGFGPNAPILKITSGPLRGLEVYYGHAGSDLVHVGQRVHAGQQISEVGYGIVGISTGPHLEIGFYPPGPNGSGSRMLSVINGLLHQHPSGRTWGTPNPTAHAAKASSANTAAAGTSAASANANGASAADTTSNANGSSTANGGSGTQAAAPDSSASTQGTSAASSQDTSAASSQSGSPENGRATSSSGTTQTSDTQSQAASDATAPAPPEQGRAAPAPASQDQAAPAPASQDQAAPAPQSQDQAAPAQAVVTPRQSTSVVAAASAQAPQAAPQAPDAAQGNAGGQDNAAAQGGAAVQAAAAPSGNAQVATTADTSTSGAVAAASAQSATTP